MTVIAAWKSDEGVMVLSDTGVTDNGNARDETSSFGQSCLTYNGDYIHEALLKICVFRETVVLGYASNDVDNALEIIELFKNQLEQNVPVNQALERATVSGAPIGGNRSSAFVVAYIDDTGPQLLHTDTDTVGQVESVDRVQIGSLPSRYLQLTQSLEAEMDSRGLAIHGRLLALLALMHEFACHEDLISFGVAGTFVGVVLNHEGLLWQPDMGYILYDEEGGSVRTGEIVWVACRDGGVIVKQNWPSRFKILLNSFNTRDPDQWDKKWGARLSGQMPLGIPLRWVFINRMWRKVLLLEKRPDTNNYHLAVSLDGQDKAHVRLSDQLNQLLTQKPYGATEDCSGPTVEFFAD